MTRLHGRRKQGAPRVQNRGSAPDGFGEDRGRFPALCSLPYAQALRRFALAVEDSPSNQSYTSKSPANSASETTPLERYAG